MLFYWWCLLTVPLGILYCTNKNLHMINLKRNKDWMKIIIYKPQIIYILVFFLNKQIRYLSVQFRSSCVLKAPSSGRIT